MKDKFSFLFSTRFWSAIITSASVVLIDPAFGTQPWYVSLGKFLALLGVQFTIIRTADRASEQKVVAAGVSSGQTNVASVTSIPPVE